MMTKKTLTFGSVVLALCVLVIGFKTAYAHCGKCLTDAKYFAGSLDDSKMTLAAASTIAEVETKGKAVHATVQRTDNGANVEVHVLADGKIMAVLIDCQNGKVLKKSAVNDLEGHAA
jgi:uncharacterized membrane protein YkoI